MSSGPQEFAGGVFSDAIEGGRAGASVTLGSDGVHARTPDGVTFRVPYASCRLERGGASGRMWFCRDASQDVTIFSEAKGFEEALAQAARRELGEQIAHIMGQAQREARRRALTWLVSLAALALVGVLTYFGVRQAGRASVHVLPRSVDEQLGETAIAHMDLKGPVEDDPVLTQAIDRIMKRLATGPVDGFTFEVRVVDAPIVNAFALPGGQVVVYTGLIRAAETPEQLAGVLAHEMAHVTRRHGMQRIAQSLGVIAGVQLLFGDVSGVAAVAVELLREGAINSYSREQEHEADMDAVRTLAQARVDPAALADFFALLQAKEGKLPSMVSWLGTHPDLARRVRDVRAAAGAQKRGEAEPLLDDWAEVQRRAGKKAAE